MKTSMPVPRNIYIRPIYLPLEWNSIEQYRVMWKSMGQNYIPQTSIDFMVAKIKKLNI